MADTIVDYNSAATAGDFPVYDTGSPPQWCGTVFTASETYVLTRIDVRGGETNSCPGNAQVSIYAAPSDEPSGAALDSATVVASTFPPSGSDNYVAFTMTGGITLTSGNKYCIVLRALSANPPGTGYLNYDYSNNAITGGLVFSNDSGSSWDSTYFATLDCNFRTYKASGTVYAEGTKTVTAAGTASLVAGPGKATTPGPTDDQTNIYIAGSSAISAFTWVAPVGETPDYLVYFRASGGTWALQETITDDSTTHYLSASVRGSLSYYSIYEWRVDTRDPNTLLVTTGDTWTFITQVSPSFTDFTRRSDYDADQVWQPGTGWVDINSFEFTGGGRYKGRIVVVGHQTIYFGDL